jgi:hypothetical protein
MRKRFPGVTLCLLALPQACRVLASLLALPQEASLLALPQEAREAREARKPP